MLRNALACLVLLSHVAFAGQKVQFETNLGNFVVELNNEKAPKTVANFLSYVKDGSYVGSIFHRVIPNFMAQGGGFDKSMKPLKTLDPIVNEASNGLKNNQATIAMARTSNPNSATRQFFINLKDNHFLDHSTGKDGYAVFGKVIKGFETIQKMSTIKTQSVGRYQDVPSETITIQKVTVLK